MKKQFNSKILPFPAMMSLLIIGNFFKGQPGILLAKTVQLFGCL